MTLSAGSKVGPYEIVALVGAGERDLSWFDFSFAEDISSDGKYVLFGEEGDAAGGLVSYLRNMDGSPAVRLFDGPCSALTHDVEHVLCFDHANHEMRAVPTRTGEAKTLSHDRLIHMGTIWLPGEKQFLFSGQEPEGGQRIYIQEVGSETARPITPEGARRFFHVSPDGSLLAFAMGADYQTYYVPIAGGEPKIVPGLEPGWLPIVWSADNHFLYCRRMGTCR